MSEVQTPASVTGRSFYKKLRTTLVVVSSAIAGLAVVAANIKQIAEFSDKMIAVVTGKEPSVTVIQAMLIYSGAEFCVDTEFTPPNSSSRPPVTRSPASDYLLNDPGFFVDDPQHRAMLGGVDKDRAKQTSSSEERVQSQGNKDGEAVKPQNNQGRNPKQNNYPSKQSDSKLKQSRGSVGLGDPREAITRSRRILQDNFATYSTSGKCEGGSQGSNLLATNLRVVLKKDTPSAIKNCKMRLDNPLGDIQTSVNSHDLEVGTFANFYDFRFVLGSIEDQKFTALLRCGDENVTAAAGPAAVEIFRR